MKKLLLSLALLSSFAFADNKDELNISFVKSPFNIQLMVMKEKGILEKKLNKHNIKLNFLEINSGAEQARALAAGSLDIAAVMNTASVLMANGENNNIKIISGVARPKDVYGIVCSCEKISDLKGKTIVGPKGTVLHQILVSVLKSENLTIDDINFISMDISKASTALLSKQADAALLAANMKINAQKEGFKVLATANGFVSPLLVSATTEKFLKEHQDLVDIYLEAQNEAWDFVINHKQEAIEIGAAMQNLSFEEAKSLFDASFYTQTLNDDDIKGLQADLEFLLDNEMMRNEVDVKTIVADFVLAKEE